MNILADHCVHTDVVECLRGLGFSVTRAGEAGLAQAPDEKIFQHALAHGQVLLTFDHDFGNIIRFPATTSPGIVIAYIEGLSRERIIAVIAEFFRSAQTDDLKGKLWLLESHRVRTWPENSPVR